MPCLEESVYSDTWGPMCEGDVGNTLTGTWNIRDTRESRWELQSHMMPDFLKSHEVYKGHGFTARRQILTWLIANKHWTAVSVSSVPECSNRCLNSVQLERWGVPRYEVHYQCYLRTDLSLHCDGWHPFLVKMFWVTQDLLFKPSKLNQLIFPNPGDP